MDSAGQPQPLGVSYLPQGQNFAVYAPDAEQLFLHLYEPNGGKEIARHALDPKSNRTNDVWHICLKDLPKELDYTYEVVSNGKSIGPLLDPYGVGLSSPADWGSEAPYQPRSHLITEDSFDWEGDKPLERPWEELVIYEMHVRGYTQSPSSPVQHRGKYLGLA